MHRFCYLASSPRIWAYLSEMRESGLLAIPSAHPCMEHFVNGEAPHPTPPPSHRLHHTHAILALR